jgi:GNAT superfamily N-acetyltransferase
MRFRIVKIEDTQEMREIHKLAFSADPWPGDEEDFWVAYDQHGAIAGFASATLLTGHAVFLSRAAVTLKYRGHGLHAKLIRTRLQWAKKEGCHIVICYIRKFNYPSMLNLLGEGFRFVNRKTMPRSWGDFHGMWKRIDVKAVEPTRELLDMMDTPPSYD